MVSGTCEDRPVARLADLLCPIAPDLAESARVFRSELRSENRIVAELCTYIEQFHGKQVRPALLLLTARACGGIRREHHVLAAVVEMVHIATLVHDDVLDDADIRRRAETVSRRWGNESAVLLGDLLFSHAFRLCSSLDSQFASMLIGQTAISLCTGEMIQIGNRGNHEISEADYYEIIEGKTASLIGTCCLLGARYAGADDRTSQRMNDFGIALGKAFQITDDLLDLLGDEVEVGKSLGRDVEKGKFTLPLIHYLRSCPLDRRQEAIELASSADPRRYRRIAAILADAGSISYAEQSARRLVDDALAILEELPAGEPRAGLQTLAEFVIARSR